MRVAANHPASVLVVLGAFLSVATVFVYARPEQHSYTPDAVQRAFAAHGVRLRYAASPDGARVLRAGDVRVVIGRNLGPKVKPYDERFGGVDVAYRGRDEKLLQRVRAAVADLR
jgi:hypothetical protein